VTEGAGIPTGAANASSKRALISAMKGSLIEN
jgi:hypothetical protein